MMRIGPPKPSRIPARPKSTSAWKAFAWKRCNMEPLVITLKDPIEVKDVKVEKLTFTRRLKAKDFKGMPDVLGQDEHMLLISRRTGVELYLIENLDGYDYTQVQGVLRLFLGSG